MEAEEKEIAEKEVQELTVDFSNQTLKKIERASDDQQLAVALILDDNELQRLDNLDTYTNLKKLSLVSNQLIRMYGVSPLVHLESLDISNNSLMTVEGLKELKELKHLNLSKNKIKTIEHLNSNLNLEKIDLSENYITHISDLSHLGNLKELNLHSNRISHLRQCDKFLPENLEILLLNNNSVCDLNEISFLVNLVSLKELSFANNPCVDFEENQKKFNYRPFVKNWCSSLIVLDNCPLDDIECLKAEWLYSQGRGRSFRSGEQAALVEYLSSVCPKKAEQSDEAEDMKKLKLILSKAQLHQQQLREQLSTGNFNFKSHISRKKTAGISERMVTSFQESQPNQSRYSPEIMTRSLDSNLMRNSPQHKNKEMIQTPLQASTTFIPIPDTLVSPDICPYTPVTPVPRRPSSLSSRASLSSSRNSLHSTPESKRKTHASSFRRQDEDSGPTSTLKKQGKLAHSRASTPGKSSSSRGISSPGRRANNVKERGKNYRETSEEDDSEISALKVLAIQQRANQRKMIKKHQAEMKKESAEKKENIKNKKFESILSESEAWKAAVCIQRRWRGYRARNLNGEVLTACKNIQMNRMQDYIMKVMCDMEATRVALEGNRKLQVLQMQAINALWKKMTALQPIEGDESDSKAGLKSLLETCSNLNKQVEGLQMMMKAMQETSPSHSSIPIATQTEIVAVHTPQGEGKEVFPYYPKLKSSQSVTFPLFNSCSRGLGAETGISPSSFTKNSAVDSFSKGGETAIEPIADCSVKDSEKEDIVPISESTSKSMTFLSDKLTKPSVKLNENSSGSPGQSNEDLELHDTSKS